ncbi:hypothetical protein P2318_22940 [Myxococcaceae bacterium GXIMD 01537]
MLASVAGAHTPPPPAPTDQVTAHVAKGAVDLSWSDPEERLRGSIVPAMPRAGEPLKVQLDVGSFQGATFEGPLTITLREAGETQGQTVVVKRGEKGWTAEFVPTESGPHLLDISFRTTRFKVVHAKFDVAAAVVPRLIAWSIFGALTVGLLVFSIRGLVRGERQMTPGRAEPTTPEAPPTPKAVPETPPAAEATPAAAASPAPEAQPAPSPEAQPASTSEAEKPSAA